MSRVPRSLLCVACFLVAAAALSRFATPAQASGGCDKVASSAGSDSDSGALGSPYRTVQKLVNSLSAGKTGCLRGGRYAGAVDVRTGGSSSAPLTLTGYPGEKATVVGEFEVHKTAPHVIVEHLYLDGRRARTSPIVNARDVTFRYDDVTNHHTGICFILGDAGGVWGRADRAVIEHNTIHDCGRLPVTNLDHGIYVEAATGARIEGNWIYDNADFGVHLYPNAHRTEVRGNVIDGNGMGATFSGDGGYASSNNKVEGNVISNSRVRWNVESWWGSGVGSGNVARANCLYATNRRSYYDSDGGVDTSGGGFTKRSNKVANPRYANRSARDLRLAPGSRCRGVFAGDPNAVPGPDGTAPAARAAGRRRFRVRMSAARRGVRHGGRVRLRGRIRRSSVRPGQRVLIYARAKRHRRLVDRARVSRTGRFGARPRVRTHARTVRYWAVVAHVGRSRAVRVRVRH
jgi:parallel beta-helix repeat protein